MGGEKLRSVWTNLERSLGPFVRVEHTSAQEDGNFRTVAMSCQMRGAGLDVQFIFDGAGRVSGLFFQPNDELPPIKDGWAPPSYADTDEFQEEVLRLGSAPGEEAVLTRPRRFSHALPVLILVPEAEHPDRDARSGERRPHKDLAFGLASLGVAVLRFARSSNPVEADVSRAVLALGQHPALDPRRIALAVRSATDLPVSPTARSSLAAVIWWNGAETPERSGANEAEWRLLSFQIRAPTRASMKRAWRTEHYPALDSWLYKPSGRHVHAEVVEDMASFLHQLPVSSKESAN